MLELSGSPLLATKRDTSRLVGRAAEAKRLIEAVSRGYNVAVFGRRGTGKSSLLHWGEFQLREQRRIVFVDASLVSDAAGFLQLVRYRLGLAPTTAEDVRDTFSALFRPQRPRDELSEVLFSLEALEQPLEADAPWTTVIVDDLDALVAHTVFGRLRNELWALPYRWVVAGDEEARSGFLTPPADSFFDVVIELGPMSEDELVAALAARAGAEAVDVDLARELAELADGNPRRFLAAAREAFLGGADARELKAARIEQLARLKELSESARNLFADLEARGQASAADEELLKRLGWSRQRARRAFDELEEAGLVVAQAEVRQGPGRPRKVYSVEFAAGV